MAAHNTAIASMGVLLHAGAAAAAPGALSPSLFLYISPPTRPVRPGATIDAMTTDGSTPLHYAVGSHPNAVAVLLAYGAGDSTVAKNRVRTCPRHAPYFLCCGAMAHSLPGVHVFIFPFSSGAVTRPAKRRWIAPPHHVPVTVRASWRCCGVRKLPT